MDTRQWIEPPGASVSLLPPCAPLPSNVRCLTTLRHALCSDARGEGSQRFHAVAGPRLLLPTAHDTG